MVSSDRGQRSRHPFVTARTLSFACVALLGATAACGGDTRSSSSTTAGSATAPSTSAPSTSAPSTSAPSTSASSTSALPTTSGATDTSLPGTETDGPPAGSKLAVVGVAHDDILESHAAPGEDTALVTTLAPTQANLIATGRARMLPRSIWWEVEANGELGWVGSSFVGWLGLTDDVTAQVIADHGTTPSGETMVDLGQLVAATRVDGAEVTPRIEMSIAPTVGDLGEVTVDVVGFADDSVLGERLHVFATPGDSGNGFVLKSVERTVLCGRGVTSDGLCI